MAEWYPTAETEGEITNGHTGDYLDADTADNGTIIQEPYIIDGIFWSMVPGT